MGRSREAEDEAVVFIFSGSCNKLQLTIEQDGFELQGSAYIQIMFQYTYYCVYDLWLVDSVDVVSMDMEG